MVARIKAGKKNADANNPSIQDLIQAVQKGSLLGKALKLPTIFTHE